MERALFVIMALGANAVAMGPWAMRGPLAVMLRYPAQTIRTIERKLNRPERTLIARRQRGLLLMVAVLMMALAAGMVAGSMHWRLMEIMILALLLPVRPTWDLATSILKALQAGDIANARQSLKDTVWRHYALLDDHALARAAIEILAVSFGEKILAPVLWYMVLGMPGFLANKSLYLLNENLCQPMGGASGFRQPVSILHTIINYIPSRLCMLLWLPAVLFLPSSGSLAAIKQIVQAIAGKKTPEQLSVLAAASVLSLSLGGPTSVYTQGEWLGNGTAKAGISDIKQALYLFTLLHLFVGIFLGLCL